MTDVMIELTDRIADLFAETGEAHHQAFIETNGVDPDWPLWYSQHLMDKLLPLIDADMTRSELVFNLVRAEIERMEDAPGANWKRFYAQFFIDRYL